MNGVPELLIFLLEALPVMIAAGLAYWFVRRAMHKKRFGGDFKEVRRRSRLNEIIGLLLVIWSALIVSSTLLPSWGQGFHFVFPPHWKLIPESVIKGDILGKHELLNMLIFVPVGLAVPFVLKGSGFRVTVLTGFCATFTIEFWQGFSGSRDGNTDDVITNTLGVMVGYLLYLLMKLIFPKFTAKCMVKAENVI